MKILYCNDDLMPRTVDSCYEDESRAASECGLTFELLDFSAVRSRLADASVRFTKAAEVSETAVYRGWMVTPSEYSTLYDALANRNIQLINSPEEYRHCHWLPESYSVIEGHTPRSVWIPAPASSWDMNAVTETLMQFGSSPVIVKDYVKSRKHEWTEACFIPDASDNLRSTQVVRRFIELQDDDLQGGLVFREFVEFEPIGTHPKSGMPLTLEYRLFVFDGSVIAEAPYWEGQAHKVRPPIAQFESLLKQVKSRFFTCDVAKTKDGRWLIVELGDAQVAGLPERCDRKAFYEALAKRIDGQ